jgi:hypothetical protein
VIQTLCIGRGSLRAHRHGGLRFEVVNGEMVGLGRGMEVEPTFPPMVAVFLGKLSRVYVFKFCRQRNHVIALLPPPPSMIDALVVINPYAVFHCPRS